MIAWLQTSSWAYPALESAHLVGVALLLGNLVLLELRVLGWGGELPLQALARLSLAVVLAGFGLALASGLLLFATQAADLLGNRAFTLKMALIWVAGCNAAWFHARGSLQRRDRLCRLQMGASTLIWLGVLVCGRWIAYQ